MHRVHLFHWNEAEAAERAERLRALGYEVAVEARDGGSARALRDDPPDAVVIDLHRLPSHGRDVAVFLRNSKATRHVPLVVVGGRRDKVAMVTKVLPDVVFTTWDAIEPDLAEAIANPLADPVVPGSNLVGYSGTPLPKKLGIKEGTRVSLVGAVPEDFEDTLGELPSGASLVRGPGAPSADLRLWFIRWQDDLYAGVADAAAQIPSGGLWMVWPKKSAKLESDLGEGLLRDAGLAHGLVDYKVCAVDKTWSGLKFAVRKK